MANFHRVQSIDDKELRSVLHPNETSRFVLALVVTMPVVITALILTFVTFGGILLFLAFLVFSIWFTLLIMKAQLVANSVLVSEVSFPEVFNVYLDVKKILNYDGDVKIFIVEAGTINAFIAKFFNTKFIILNSGLVKGMIKNEDIIQMKWIIARFIGALKAKHLRLTLLKAIINSIEQIKIFNLFILPYERAIQYSGDQIGLVVSGDLTNAIIAFDKFMVGNELAKRVEFRGIINQSKTVKNDFFAMLARLFSTHPHLTDRYLNLLAFANWRYPDQYFEFISEYDEDERKQITRLLPGYFEKNLQKP